MDEKKVDIVDLISNLLDSGKCKEALSVPNDEKHVEHVKDNCWDLISSIIGKIDNQTAVTKPSLQRTCEELISIVVQKATPEEALLELIEQIEVAKNDAQFSTLLIPLQKLLKKLSIKRGRSLEWCLNSISTYIESIPIPEHQLEGKERLLLDCDPNIRRIITVYSVLPHFYEPFVSEVTTPNANLRTKQIITAFLVSLLGKPLIYLDLDPEVNQHAFRQSRRCLTSISPVTTSVKNIKTYSNYASNVNTPPEVKVTTVPSENEDSQYEDDVKTKILEKALDFVAKSGWSVESLSLGAEAAGYPGVTHGLFPNGGGDLVHYFNVKCNKELIALMKCWPKEEIKESTVPSKFVESAIITRLLMIEHYKSSWPKAMAIQALPNNVPNCLATLLSLVDDICYHSGDRSVDFNWYVRRVGLAGIYKASELFYLTDKTEGSSATKNFVAARIRDAQLIQTAMSVNPITVAPQTLTAAFITAKNMLGINSIK